MKFKTHITAILIALVPFIYLAYLWNDLPNDVPIHFNAHGIADDYGSKFFLLFIPCLLPTFMYVVFILCIRLDPIKKLDPSSKKFNSLLLGTVIIFTLLSIYILYSTQGSKLFSADMLLIIIGILYMFLGNYFQTLKRNFFIGIKTPWTLQSDEVWKRTHKLGGYIWVIGGLIVIISSLLVGPKINLIIFLTITAIMLIVPVVHSYRLFEKEKTMDNPT